MAINFPNNPSTGDEFTASGKTWTWNGAQWEGIPAIDPAANNFNLDVGQTGNNTYILSSIKSAGMYSITSQLDDAGFDVYAITSDGQLSGYTNTKSFSTTLDFDKIVVYGAIPNDILAFEFKQTVVPTSSGLLSSGAAPYLVSADPSSLPSIDDTTTIVGGNFSDNLIVKFIGTDLVERNAKNIVRLSSSQIIATRPDTFPISTSPYSISVSNAGIPNPSSTNINNLNNYITSGTNPVWQTGSSLLWTIGVTSSITLLATDTEATDIDYTIVSGTLPTGLSLDQEAGIISGTINTETSQTFTVRATDAGGNYVDREFTMVVNNVPEWITPSGSLGYASNISGNTFQLSATGGLQHPSLSYSLASGSLPSGMSMTTDGVIAGQSTQADSHIANFVVRVSDTSGYYSDRSFSITTLPPVSGGTTYSAGGYTYHKFISSSNISVNTSKNIDYLIVAGGGGTTSYGGGGGAGGMITGSTLIPVGTYPITIGSGGNSSNGGNSTFYSITATGGGKGSGYSQDDDLSGGSGGGSSGSGSTGIAGQGNSGGSGGGPNAGGGGGRGSAGASVSSNDGATGGSGLSWLDGNMYAAGGGGGTGYSGALSGVGGSGIGGGRGVAPTANTGSGGGGTGYSPSYGGSQGAAGVVIIRYQ